MKAFGKIAQAFSFFQQLFFKIIIKESKTKQIHIPIGKAQSDTLE